MKQESNIRDLTKEEFEACIKRSVNAGRARQVGIIGLESSQLELDKPVTDEPVSRGLFTKVAKTIIHR